MVKIPTLSNGTDNIRCVIGFGDSVAGSMTNGIWIENDYSIHFNNFWYLATSWGGAGHTYVAIGSNAAGAGAWCRLNFEIAADGDAVTGSVNGSGSNVITSTIPTAVQVNQIVYCRKIAGTNTRNFHCDYVRMWQVFTGSRE